MSEVSVRSYYQKHKIEERLNVEASKDIEESTFKLLCSAAQRAVSASRNTLQVSLRPNTLITFVEASKWQVPNSLGYFYKKLPYGKIVVRFDSGNVQETEGIVCHEYTHALVRALSRGSYKCPIWLDEGVARYVSQSAGYAIRRQFTLRSGIDIDYLKDTEVLLSRTNPLLPSTKPQYNFLVDLSVLALHHHADLYGCHSIETLVSDLSSSEKRNKSLISLLQVMNTLLTLRSQIVIVAF